MPPEFIPLIQLTTPFQPYAKREHGSGFTRTWCIVGTMAISAAWLGSRPDVDENSTGWLSEDPVIFVMETVSVVLWFLNAAFGYKTVRMTGMLKTSLIINVQSVSLLSSSSGFILHVSQSQTHFTFLDTQQNWDGHHKNNQQLYELWPYLCTALCLEQCYCLLKLKL